jgi:hypothetical protein
MATKLKLRNEAHRNAQTLIRRIVLSKPDMVAGDIHALLEGAGVQISLASVSMTASDMRKTIRLLEREGLLRSGFEQRRLDIEPCLVETRSAAQSAAPARPRRDGSRGRT